MVGEDGGGREGGREGEGGGDGGRGAHLLLGDDGAALAAVARALGDAARLRLLGPRAGAGGVGTRAFLRSTHPDGSNDAPGESAVWTTSVRRASGSSSSRSPTASLEPGSDGAAICAGRHDVVSESSSSASASLPSRPATAGGAGGRVRTAPQGEGRRRGSSGRRRAWRSAAMRVRRAAAVFREPAPRSARWGGRPCLCPNPPGPQRRSRRALEGTFFGGGGTACRFVGGGTGAVASCAWWSSSEVNGPEAC